MHGADTNLYSSQFSVVKPQNGGDRCFHAFPHVKLIRAHILQNLNITSVEVTERYNSLISKLQRDRIHVIQTHQYNTPGEVEVTERYNTRNTNTSIQHAR